MQFNDNQKHNPTLAWILNSWMHPHNNSPEEAGAGATTGRALARHDECRVDARILVACYDLVITTKHFTQQRIQLEVSLHVSLHDPPVITVHPCHAVSLSTKRNQANVFNPRLLWWLPDRALLLVCIYTTGNDPRFNNPRCQRLAMARSIHNRKRQHLADARNNYKLQCMMAPSVRTLGLLHGWRFCGFLL